MNNKDKGLVTISSEHDVSTTIDKLSAIAEEKGLKIFARIDHAAGAKSVDQDLRPTQLLIFGNPQGGTPMMLSNQTAGLDLPLKALAWEDADGKTWLTYNDPAYLSERHDLAGVAAIEKITQALAGLSKAATE